MNWGLRLESARAKTRMLVALRGAERAWTNVDLPAVIRVLEPTLVIEVCPFRVGAEFLATRRDRGPDVVSTGGT